MIIPFRGSSDKTLLLTHAKLGALIVLGFCVVSYFFFDRALALVFAQIPLWFNGIATSLTNIISPTVSFIAWPLFYFFFRYVTKKPKTAQWILILIIAVPLSNASCGLLKWICGRARPELFLTQGLYEFSVFNAHNLFQSFPSAHATVSGAIAGVLCCYRPQWSMAVLAISVVLGFTRVVLGEHFLSDVIAGVFIGALIAQWTYKKIN